MENNVNIERKKACAINLMRTMLMKCSKSNNIPFEDAFIDFAKSSTYSSLFDFDTGIWKEGPDYLMEIYIEENKLRNQNEGAVTK